MIKDLAKYIFIVIFLTLPVFSQTIEHFSINLKEKLLPFGLKVNIPEKDLKTSLVLSGGGSLGLSQIGILKAFEENNIRINSIVGASMGSIIGGLYSSGYDIGTLTEIAIDPSWQTFALSNEISRNELFLDDKLTEDRALFAVRLDGLNPVIPSSINQGQRISNFLNILAIDAPLHPGKDFSSLLYNFSAISTNIVTGEKIILNKGSFSRALRASSSVSLLLPPVEIDSLLLADGGLVENLPVQTALELGNEFIIAVNTSTPLQNKDDLEVPWNIADQMISIPMKKITTQNSLLADILITPNLNGKRGSDFSDVKPLIDSGYACALNNIKFLQAKIEQKIRKSYPDSIISSRFLSLPDSSSETDILFFEQYKKRNSFSTNDIYYFLHEQILTGNFKNAAADLICMNDSVSVKFCMKENPLIQNVMYEGVSNYYQKKLASYKNLLINKPFNPNLITKILLEILREYRKEGYSLARVNHVTFNEMDNDLTINFSEGVVSKILVGGNLRTNDEVILREFSIKVGDYFNKELALEGLKNLKSTDLFEDVEMIVEDSDIFNVVKIFVKEKLPRVLRFGFRSDNEYMTQILLDLRELNLFGTGTELGVVFSGGTRNRSFSIEHKSNRIFETYLTYKIKAFQEFEDINVFKDENIVDPKRFSRGKTGEYRRIYTGLSIGVGTQFQKFGNVILEGKWQNDRIKNLSNSESFLFDENIASIKLSLSIDSQDKYPFPNKGFLVNTYYETSQELFGGNLSYAKFDYNYKGYFTLNQLHTLTTKFKFGFADKTVPSTRLFSFGGHDSFYGYNEHDYVGKQILIASLGYRFKLPFKILVDTYIEARYDLGSAWAEREQIKLNDLKHGIGFSLAFDSPIGPLNFAVGRSFLLGAENVSYGPVNYYFSVGFFY